MTPEVPREPRFPAWAVPVLVGVVAFLPFARGVVSGASFYFRDLSRQFFPFRRFAAEGLRHGELRYWNSLVHEGEPLSLLPVAYPPDLLHALLPSEWAFSLLLALHVPLAALFFFALARELGLGRAAAAGGGLVYALGGFALSSLNLYVHAQALAWSPLVVRGVLRAARGATRDAALGALAFAVALTTSGVEIVAQAILIALVLAWPLSQPAARSRVAMVFSLGVGLAAFSLFPVWALVGESARGSGFPVEVVLAHSVHPLAFLQVLAAGFFGDPSHVAGGFWGQRFFPLGFPYVVSLYLGAAALALAALGVIAGGVLRRRLAILALLAALVCLGSWAGLGPVAEWLEPLRRFRYPSKAFFTVHFAVALLAALGLEAVRKAEGSRAVDRLGLLALVLGAPLAASPLAPALLPRATRWFAAGFFPPDMPWGQRLDSLRLMTADAALGGFIALVLGAVAFAARRGSLRAPFAAATMAGLVGADLLRAGAGLNPMVTPSFYSLSPEMAAVARRLNETGGRIFTCDVAQSPAYLAARGALGPRQEVWSFALLRETMTPYYNLGPGVSTALSLDLTMLTPRERVASPDEAACRDLPSLLERLREAGVTHVLSLDPLESADLLPEAVVEPEAVRPLPIRLYALREPRPLAEVGGRPARVVRERPGLVEVEAESEGTLVVRQTAGAGWQASVEGRDAPLLATEGGHLAVAVGGGRTRVRFEYRPFVLLAGALISLASLGALVSLVRRRRPH
jgi:hypothetical protein